MILGVCTSIGRHELYLGWIQNAELLLLRVDLGALLVHLILAAGQGRALWRTTSANKTRVHIVLAIAIGRTRAWCRFLASTSLLRRVLGLIQLGNGHRGRASGIVQSQLGTGLDLLRLRLLLQGGQRG